MAGALVDHHPPVDGLGALDDMTGGVPPLRKNEVCRFVGVFAVMTEAVGELRPTLPLGEPGRAFGGPSLPDSGVIHGSSLNDLGR